MTSPHTTSCISADTLPQQAQGSAVFQLGGNGPTGQTVWLGNQWNSGLSQTPPGPRHHDLLYWALLEFDANGGVKQATRQPNVTLTLSPCEDCEDVV